MNSLPNPDKELALSAFEQLMEHVRKQDDLIHSWTKYYLSVQAALAVALSFLIKLQPAKGILVSTGSVFIPLLGIVTSICLTNIILREQFWQGRYIAQIRKLPLIPEIYRGEWAPDEPDPELRGYIGKQFCWLRNSLVAGWVIWALVSVYAAIWR
jgi:hypothetical protein